MAFLDEGDGLGLGQDAGQLEEAGLHDRVDPETQAELARDLQGVDVVDLDLLVDDRPLHVRGQVLEDVLGLPVGIDEEDPALADPLEDVQAADVGGFVQGDEIHGVEEILRLDGALAEAQVGDGDTAGLFGVVLEIALAEHVRVVGDDLDGVLVGADRAVRAVAPELAADRAGELGVEDGAHGDGGVGDVVVDADGEAVGRRAVEVIVDGLDHGRREFLGREAVAAADHLEPAPGEGHGDVEEERLADGAGLLGPVEDRDLLDGLGQGGVERLGVEGPVQAHLDQTQLGALGVQVVDRLLGRLGAGAHHDDDLLGIRGAEVIEQVVLAADHRGHLVHVMLDDAGALVVVLVDRFPALEVDVGVLLADLEHGPLGIEGAAPEGLQVLGLEQPGQRFIGRDVDLFDDVRGPEAVEEVQERDPAPEGREVGDDRQVLAFLDRAGAGQGEAGVAGGHDVAVVPEDRQGLAGQRAGRDQEDRRQHLAGDLVHVGQHEHQALGRGEGRGQGARRERAVDRARGAALGLHLDDVHFLAEDVLAAVGGPLVRQLAHRRGRRDGVDRRDLGISVGHVRRRRVPVDRLVIRFHPILLRRPGRRKIKNPIP